jgi:uncharacterized protein
MNSAEEVISKLGLVPLGFEGGYYRETGRSAFSTSIFYLHTPESMGLMHRLVSDEVYHFYLGDPVEMLLLPPEGGSETVHLGQDLSRDQHVQLRIPAMTWQGSRLVAGGRFALMGTTMAPGFDLAGFELGDRDDLLAAHPDRTELLLALTPDRIKTERLELAAATVDLIHAELRSRAALAAGLRAEISDWPPPLNDEESARFVLAKLELGRPQRGWWSWYLVERSTRALIGVAGFKGPPDAQGMVEMGWSIVPSHQRRGFAVEASVALLDWARARGARRFSAETLPELLPSMRVMEKLGFARVPGRDPAIVRYERDA